MENATKALLIAAAVLIVILLIAFGMRIFNSTSDVSGQAQSTGIGISEQIDQTSSGVIGLIKGQTEQEKFNSQFSKYISEDGVKHYSNEEGSAILKNIYEIIDNVNRNNSSHKIKFFVRNARSVYCYNVNGISNIENQVSMVTSYYKRNNYDYYIFNKKDNEGYISYIGISDLQTHNFWSQ